AIKFCAPGVSPKVQLSVVVADTSEATPHAPKAEWCEIVISDNGIGFEPSDWPLLIRGFQRQHSRDRFEGTGLGLAICQSIVDWHGGSLTASSEPGKGCTLTLKLPLRQPVRPESDRMRSPAPSSLSSHQP
ncbi:MAG: sensor histidine kinase, partial [Verrucomicrobia bacterium]|nr:sensor histidine kinase [Verrucomicrobiota bacterium]